MSKNIEERHALMRVDEVAAVLGQCRETVYRKIASGEIAAVRLGGERSALRVRRDVLERWLGSE